MSKKLHWTQTEEGRERMRQIQKLRFAAKKIVKAAKKRGPYKSTKEKKETSLVINGWRITLGKNEVRIDND